MVSLCCTYQDILSFCSWTAIWTPLLVFAGAGLVFESGRPRFRIWPTSWSNFGRTRFHGCPWLLYLARLVADIVTILSCLYYNLNGQKLSSNTLSTQLPNVLSNFTLIICLIWQLSSSTRLRSGNTGRTRG